MHQATTPTVISPTEAASRLGIPVSGLVAIIRRHRYCYTELAHGGRPGDRGRNRWGLTLAQFEAIVRGQERGFREPEPEQEKARIRAALSALSPDGKDRLPRGRHRLRLPASNG